MKIKRIKITFYIRLALYLSLSFLSWLTCFLNLNNFSWWVNALLLSLCFILSMISIRGTFIFTDHIRNERFSHSCAKDQEFRFAWESRVFQYQLFFRIVIATLAVFAYFIIVMNMSTSNGNTLISALVIIFSLEHIMGTKRFNNHVRTIKSMISSQCTTDELNHFIMKISLKDLIVKETHS